MSEESVWRVHTNDETRGAGGARGGFLQGAANRNCDAAQFSDKASGKMASPAWCVLDVWLSTLLVELPAAVWLIGQHTRRHPCAGATSMAKIGRLHRSLCK